MVFCSHNEARQGLGCVHGGKIMHINGKDDMAHIPLGIPAANKQCSILMTMEYTVTLRDHTFVVATRHKATLSWCYLFM